LLDIGAGPGLLAIGFAPYCGEVLGVDPEPAMVEAARAAAARAGVKATFIEGRFEDKSPSLGVFDVVTIGRAIHWLDPAPARAALDRVVKPHGRILVCHAGSVEDGRNPWLDAFKAVRDRWKDDRPHYDPDAFFAGGRFAPSGSISVEAAYSIPVERLADRILSMSTSSPARLGDEVPAMRIVMRAALAPFAPDGVIQDIVEARAERFESAGRDSIGGGRA
jgi:SAM-dependent methyltransferase